MAADSCIVNHLLGVRVHPEGFHVLCNPHSQLCDTE